MRSSNKAKRNERGSVLVFTCAALIILAVCVVMAYSVSGLYFQHNRLQASADEIALTGAKKLNERNRIGQMNNIISRCRQLVYSDRDDLKKIKDEFPEVEEVANQLLTESRDSAMELDRERKKMRNVIEVESTDAMRAKFNTIKNTYPMTLPWMRVRSPRVISVGLGRIDGIESNVEEFNKFDKLKKFDRDQGNTKTFNKMTLYKGDKNQQLNEDDTDLPFFLTSLPAPINSEVSPARTLLPNGYREADDEPIPTATRVVLDLRVESGAGTKSIQTMTATGTALTAGASNQE